MKFRFKTARLEQVKTADDMNQHFITAFPAFWKNIVIDRYINTFKRLRELAKKGRQGKGIAGEFDGPEGVDIFFQKFIGLFLTALTVALAFAIPSAIFSLPSLFLGVVFGGLVGGMLGWHYPEVSLGAVLALWSTPLVLATGLLALAFDVCNFFGSGIPARFFNTAFNAADRVTNQPMLNALATVGFSVLAVAASVVSYGLLLFPKGDRGLEKYVVDPIEAYFSKSELKARESATQPATQPATQSTTYRTLRRKFPVDQQVALDRETGLDVGQVVWVAGKHGNSLLEYKVRITGELDTGYYKARILEYDTGGKQSIDIEAHITRKI